jgi:cytochrome d ubiquinol oxidase subunit I
VIGQTLAMEGMFAFFLESAFIGLFLFGEKRLEPKGALVVGLRGFCGLLAVGLFHHRH